MTYFSTEKLLSQLSALIRERGDPENSQIFDAFAKCYYKHVAEQDLQSLSLDDIYGALLSHWNLAQKRVVGEAKLSVFNPSLEQHSWQSTHTIIEIVVEDMPFLVQSTLMEINRLGLTNHLAIHPVLPVSRNDEGRLFGTMPGSTVNPVKESFIHVQISRQSDNKEIDFIKNRLSVVLNAVKAANDDWDLCLEALDSTCKNLTANLILPESDVEEAVAFLQWLVDKHFVFLGFQEFEVVQEAGRHSLKVISGSGLGILRDGLFCGEQNAVTELSDDAFDFISRRAPLVITKSTIQSMVHRAVYVDYIGVKRFDGQGRFAGELRFLGLYSASAYRSLLDEIPIVRNKVERVFQRAGFGENSHSGRSLLHIIEELPRDEVFYSDPDQLFEIAMGVFFLRDRQRVRVFVRHDVYGQYFSAIVYVPRENFHTNNRKIIQDILLQAFNGQSIEFQVVLSESLLARIYFVIHVCETCIVEFDIKAIEQKIIEAISEWKDGLHEALVSQYGEEQCDYLISEYGDAFSAAYREDFRPKSSVIDMVHLEALNQTDLQIILYSPLELEDKQFRIKLYCAGDPAPISVTLPMLENMGVTVIDERSYRITKKGVERPLWIHDFGISYETAHSIDFESIKPSFEETFKRVWFGQIENDGFNRLAIAAHMDWKSINLFRAFYFYLHQIGIAFSQNYVETTLANNPEVVRSLFKLFDAELNPNRISAKPGADWISLIEKKIEQVQSLDEDRILRRYLNLIRAIVRTNYYQDRQDDDGIPYFSFKFDPAMLIELPRPRPFFEIFVYSPKVEGVHLRAGPIARGGLRWSDRREDFRTEILGLLKAQMAKNAIIIPSGAKGGFVVKQLTKGTSRSELQESVVSCYRVFIRGLLDITDNLVGDGIRKPEHAICRDGDDPYLVVAADKGTATFSDIANSIANHYGFWLGDAFASGGSIGYDHKEMGITARGAWVSVARHFSELGTDIQATPFSVIGIGDMSGDVFGNGMLLSNQIRLVGAFNHQHILLDPDSDPLASFNERKRLFDLPGSTWLQYDEKCISKGGGIYSRSAKSIYLSKEVKQVFGLSVDRMTPDELIRQLLKAPVDLLWNGGIGTYVKAADERHEDVGDRANDSVRVNGHELNCKVVGEGGNLGFTQRGRIEFSQSGGRINTDSVDNSAGVDCSDHEVNIKILLNQVLRKGDLTDKQRNRFLEDMMAEVAKLVLRNNFLQAKAITMIEGQSVEAITLHQRVICRLEQQGHLDRLLENLPDDEELAERKAEGKGLFRPEISVLMAYCKLALKLELLHYADKFDADHLQRELERYFPQRLTDIYADELTGHYLSKEIISNQMVNSVINRLGLVFPFRLMDETGANMLDLTLVYRDACQIFNIRQLWRELDSLNGVLDPTVLEQLDMEVRLSLERTMFWLLQNLRAVAQRSITCEDLEAGIDKVSRQIPNLLLPDEKTILHDRIQCYVRAGVPRGVAARIAYLSRVFVCLDVIVVSHGSDRAFTNVAKLFFKVDGLLHLRDLRSSISSLPRDHYWQSLSRTALREEFHYACRALITDVLVSKGRSFQSVIDAWCKRRKLAIDRYQKMIHDFQLEDAQELEKLTVAVKALRAISRL